MNYRTVNIQDRILGSNNVIYPEVLDRFRVLLIGGFKL